VPEKDKTNQKEPHHPHDKGYKQLLSNKRAFLQLIKTFVREEWVKEINEDDLIPVNRSYILQDFSEKEADIVYRLQAKETNVIFYVLLELQSTVDYTMPFRLLLYMTEIWRDVYNNTPENERERKDFRLPAIIPAVLYNGAGSWTASTKFKEILSGYEKFPKHILDFGYILFDVNRYSEEELYRAANLISSVFVLDQTMDHRELTGRLRKLIGVLKKLTPDEFKQIMTWLKNVVKPKMPEYLQEEVDRILEISNPWEVEMMITNLELTLDEMKREALREGEKIGRMEGKMEVALAALKKGLSVDVVAEITGLPGETVLKLKKQLAN
jgi:predicted transposase/invertase (TIGR01784 family)